MCINTHEPVEGGGGSGAGGSSLTGREYLCAVSPPYVESRTVESWKT